jgi:hypothetical protein
MNRVKLVALAASVLLIEFVGCTSADISDLPSSDVSSSSSTGGSPSAGSSSSVALSSSAEIQNWCVYLSTEQCFPVSFSECPGGGFLALSCPFDSSSSFNSSSSVVGISGSSSSLGNSSSGGSSSFSSSSVLQEYAWSVFEGDQACLPGPASVCPPGGTLANVCPYVSSSSSRALSSSSVGGSSISSSSYSYYANAACEYQPSWCGGVAFENVQMNFTSFITSTSDDYNNPKCLFTRGINSFINANSGVLINNTTISGGLQYSLDNWSKVDGGYYIYIPIGAWTEISGAISSVPECIPPACGGETYNLSTHFCSSNKIYSRCGIADFNPTTQFCFSNNIYSKCGGNDYNPETEFCSSNVRYSKCSGETYAPATQICESGIVKAKCGDGYYNSATEFCFENAILSKCGGKNYIPIVQRCTGSTITCSTALSGNYLCDVRDNNAYALAVANSQVWMAEDLKYNGEKYDWATAMDLPSSCNSSPCASQINVPHQGICPSGWHLPSSEEWPAQGQSEGIGSSHYWIATEVSNDVAYEGGSWYIGPHGHKHYPEPVRCVKD